MWLCDCCAIKTRPDLCVVEFKLLNQKLHRYVDIYNFMLSVFSASLKLFVHGRVASSSSFLLLFAFAHDLIR